MRELIDIKRTGERIRRACKRRGLSVRRLQKELNIGAFQSIYNWFCGKTLPSLENFVELGRLLHLPIDSLIVIHEYESDDAEPVIAKIDRNWFRAPGEKRAAETDTAAESAAAANVCSKKEHYTAANVCIRTEHYAFSYLQKSSKNRVNEFKISLYNT